MPLKRNFVIIGKIIFISALLNRFKKITTETRKKRDGFAQLDFKFVDDGGMPINDYLFKFGFIIIGKEKPSKSVEHTYKNNDYLNHFKAFIKMKELNPKLTYYFDFNSETNSSLFKYLPDPLRVNAVGNILEYVCEDQTTYFEIVLARQPSKNLFVFERGNQQDLHFGWNRDGEINDKNLPVE